MQVGDKIRLLLEQNNLSQADLSRGLSKTPFYVHNLLKKKTADSGIIQSVAGFFGVPVTYFFDQVEDGENTVSVPKFTNKCKACQDKEQVISALKENIHSLKKIIKLVEKSQNLTVGVNNFEDNSN